ncbi:MAG: hypothetical protein IAE83_07385 [Anaerolinea sp.]|nr:hypothetical protein [Anaerolinea sp.]
MISGTTPALQRALNWAFLVLLLLVSGCGGVQPTFTPAPTALPTAPPTPVSGEALKGTSASVYRLMDDGSLRHITSWATFLSWGYTPGDIREIPEDALRLHPLAAPLSRFVTGEADSALYALFKGKRYLLKDAPFLSLIDSFPTQVSQLPDVVLKSIPLSADPYPAPAQFADDPTPVSAAVWFQGALWIAFEDGALRRFDPQTGRFRDQDWPGEGHITALRALSGALYGGTNRGVILRLDTSQTLPTPAQPGWISALGTHAGSLIGADHSHYDLVGQTYHQGQGLIDDDHTALFPASEPLRWITALEGDGSHIWAATRFTGLLRCQNGASACEVLNTFNSLIPDNTLRDLTIAPDGAVWFAHPGGITRYDGTNFLNFAVGGGLSAGGVYSLSFIQGGVWAAGDSFLAHLDSRAQMTVYSAFDHPLLLDRFVHIEADDQGVVWAVGQTGIVRIEGQDWKSYPYQGAEQAFRPGDLPLVDISADPWHHPAEDNGFCIHYLQSPSGDAFEARQQIARMQRLGMRWVLVNYLGRDQLLQLAPLFAQAGITVVWRPYFFPAQQYSYWAEDVRFLRAFNGQPPYIQVYNEPSLAQEWNESMPTDAQSIYHQNLLPAVKAVYDAGGLVGLQQIELDWLRASLQALKGAKLDYTFDRLFFVPHPYGFNHPPEYSADQHGVLGFRFFAQVFEQELGFVPPMIAGEGGWRPGEAQDSSYPAVSEKLHRDYHRAIFNWFVTGVLSDGTPKPDYLMAFCPWLLSDIYDPAAWFDSRAGDRSLTIRAIEQLAGQK